MPSSCNVLYLMILLVLQMIVLDSAFARPYPKPNDVLTACHGFIDYAEAVISARTVLHEWIIMPQVMNYEPKASKPWPRIKNYRVVNRKLTSSFKTNDTGYPFHPNPGEARLIRLEITQLILPAGFTGKLLGLMLIVESNTERTTPFTPRVFTNSIQNVQLSVASSSIRLKIVNPNTDIQIIPPTPIQLQAKYSCIQAESIELYASHLSVIPCTQDTWDGFNRVKQLPCRPIVHDHLNEIQCISMTKLCDGTTNCPAGEDESSDLCELAVSGQEREQLFRNRTWGIGINDAKVCGSESYDCARSHHRNDWPVCIPLAWTCDGQIDCPEGEDEYAQICSGSSFEESVGVTYHELCPKYTYPCVEDGRCLPFQLVCDNHVDCLAGFDEISDACEWRVRTIQTMAWEGQAQSTMESTNNFDGQIKLTTTASVPTVTQRPVVYRLVTQEVVTRGTLATESPVTDYHTVRSNYISTTSMTPDESEVPAVTNNVVDVTIKDFESNEVAVTKHAIIESSTMQPNGTTETKETVTVVNEIRTTTANIKFEEHNSSFTIAYTNEFENKEDDSINNETYAMFSDVTPTLILSKATHAIPSGANTWITDDYAKAAPTDTQTLPVLTEYTDAVYTTLSPTSTTSVVPLNHPTPFERSETAITHSYTAPVFNRVEWKAPLASETDPGNCNDWAVCKGMESLFNTTAHAASNSNRAESNFELNELPQTLSDQYVEWISRRMVTVYQDGKARCPGVLFNDHAMQSFILTRNGCLPKALEKQQIQVRPTLIHSTIIEQAPNWDDVTQHVNEFRLLRVAVLPNESITSFHQRFGSREPSEYEEKTLCHLIVQQASDDKVDIRTVAFDLRDTCFQEMNLSVNSTGNDERSSVDLCLDSNVCAMLDSGGFLTCARSLNRINGELAPVIVGYVHAKQPCTLPETSSLSRFQLLFLPQPIALDL